MRLERITRKHVAGVCLRVILPYHGALLWIHQSVCKSNVNEALQRVLIIRCVVRIEVYIPISYIRHLGIHWNETIHTRGPYPSALYVEDLHAMSGHIYACSFGWILIRPETSGGRYAPVDSISWTNSLLRCVI